MLCGGVSELIRNGFETLVEAGYQPEIAYFECLHELKLIIDLIYEGGLSWMRYSVSDTAEWGDYQSGPRVIDEHARDQMRQVLAEIQDGTFAKKWIAEADGGFPEFLRLRQQARTSQLEEVGRAAAPDDALAGERAEGATRMNARDGNVGDAIAGPTGDRVRIFDTTLRDGEQAPGIALTKAEKVEIAEQLARLNVDILEAGFPISSHGEFDAVARDRIDREGPGDRGARAHRDRRHRARGRGAEGRRPLAHPHVHLHERRAARVDAEDELPAGAGRDPRERDAREELHRRRRVLARRTRPEPRSSSCSSASGSR